MSVDRRKLRLILETDYNETELEEGQEWYIGHGRFLSLTDTKEYLLEEMEYIRDAAINACRLCRTIEEEFGRCEVTGNLYMDVLSIAEPLSIIEILVHEYLNSYSMIGHTKKEDQYSGYDPDDLPF